MPNILDEQVGTFASGFWYADQLVQLFTGLNVSAMDARLQAQTGASTVVSWTGRNGDLCPPVYYGVSGQYTLILVSCVQTLNMGVNLMNGYATPAFIAGAKENGWAKDAAQWILGQARDRHMPTTDKMVLAGYSGGGMIAQSIAQAFAGAMDGPTIRLSTFGSPREAQASICNNLRQQDVVRWMNDTDPIPLLPPHVSQLPNFSPLLPYALAQDYVSYVHCKNGVNINAAGQLRSSELPRGAILAPTLSLGAFLLGQVTAEPGAHSIFEYRARLDRGVQATPGPETPPAPTPIETDDGFSRGEWGSDAAAGARAIFVQGEAQSAVGTVIPPEQLPYLKKEGRIWNLYWGNTWIATGPKKKRALHLKRVMVDMLRSMQIQGVMSPAAFADQFSAYTNLATRLGTGFTPIMQDKFPE